MARFLRAVTHRVTSYSWFASLLDQLESWSSQRPGTLAVLTYHRVDDPSQRPDLYQGSISATPEEFDDQLRAFRRRCNFVSMQDVLAARAGATLPPRALLVTFDDAYHDFASHAWPIMRRYDVPVTLFVPTAFPGDRRRCFWWDRLAHLLAHWPVERAFPGPNGDIDLANAHERTAMMRQLRDHVKSMPHATAMEYVDRLCAVASADAALKDNHVLSWDELRSLSQQGVTLAAHTQTHPLMHRITSAEAHAEVTGSLRDLQREIGTVLPVFAYPSGGFSDEVFEVLRSASVALAFSTCRGLNQLENCNPLALRRINVGRRTNSSIVRAQMLPTVDRLISWLPVRSAV
jgi:peptidoglycan/xylan/chitin deacetylase (PgdA/CDA1 family)